MYDGGGAEHCWIKEGMQDGGGVDEWRHRFLEYLWGDVVRVGGSTTSQAKEACPR